ncbi:MAG: glycine--tRNA ligase [Candidatus Paceibacterota bacterium]
MKKNTENDNLMEKIVSLCKRRGFVYQGSEIYGGLAGTWDYGPLGVALKKNIENLWWKRFVLDREDMYGMDAAILMNQNVWKASGHVAGFADPLVECPKCKQRYRADHIEVVDGVQYCPKDKQVLGKPRQFNMMFKTHIGAMEDDSAVSYLRPETAGGMFVNFKNVMDSFHPRLPFGMAQIGKAFRNEIAPRDFIFRVRELEQMEIEYFVKPETWQENFESFRKEVHEFTKDVGISQEKVHELEVADGDRAHYSKRTIDFEFDFPFGKSELYGLVYRTDFDLKSHSVASKVDLTYFDEETKERFLPHVIEPSFGVGRTMLAVLTDAYTEDVLGDETRVYLKFSPKVAPVIAAVFPLLKNKPELVAKAREVFSELKKEFGRVMFDDNGNIGKRYRRQDEIGTPFCITVDFETLENDAGVTVRDRDTGKQERMKISELVSFIKSHI